MANEKNTTNKTPATITLTEILSIAEAAYDPDGTLSTEFECVIDVNGKLIDPDMLGDPFADALIREIGAVCDIGGDRETMLEGSRMVVELACEKLNAVISALGKELEKTRAKAGGEEA
jgi:hypothetical protein